MEVTESKIDIADLRKRVNAYSQREKNKWNPLLYVKCYNSIKDKDGYSVRIDHVIDAISEIESINTFNHKKERPIILFSVAENHTNKSDANVTKHSGVIILDIDKKDNLNMDFVELKQRICKNHHTHGCFYSPSGGLKVLVKTNIRHAYHHKSFFFKIQDYYHQQFGIDIDGSGQNLARQCFVSYDDDAYFDRYSKPFQLSKNDLNQEVINIASTSRVTGKQPLGYSSLYDLNYYEVFRSLIEKGTSVGLCENLKLRDSEKGTLVGQPCVIDINNHEKGTPVGLYNCLFNKFRYSNIYSIMSTSVPFLSLLISMEKNKMKLDYETRIDERYFGDDKQEPFTIQNGIECCRITFNEGYVIKEKTRNKTLASITMKLIFNNPFCTFERLLTEITNIHYRYLDRNASTPFTETEIYQIVAYNYQRYISGNMDFSSVIRKKNKKSDQKSLKQVFFSRDYKMESVRHKQNVAINAYNEAKWEDTITLLNHTLEELQDGTKITNKRIGSYMGVSERTIKRYFSRDVPEIMALSEIKKYYNHSLKK